MNIQAPEWLEQDCVKIFDETVRLLGKAAIELDASCIADFAKAQVDVIRLEKAVAFEGDVVIGKAGTTYINPTLSILMARRKDLMLLRHDLKLTPRARNSAIKTTQAGGLKAALDA